MAKSQLDRRDIPRRTPTLRDECLPSDIVIEEVERLIDGLLLPNYVLPASQILSNL